MKDDEEFKKALADKQVPILVLDEKWHRLFAVHGKPDEIHETENELNALLARQGKLNEELKQLKKSKKAADGKHCRKHGRNYIRRYGCTAGKKAG